VTAPTITEPGSASSYANRDLRQRAFQDLIVQAFITDRTRVIAFSGQFPDGYLKFRGSGQSALDYSQYRQFNGDTFNFGHHVASHTDQGINGGAPSASVTTMKKDWMDIYTHWQLDLYADLLAKLDSYLDIDGNTVLDNTIAVYGGDDADSTRHGYGSMPCILGGRGGATATGDWRVKSGRQLRFANYGAGASSERSWKDLLWGMMNIVGVPDPSGAPELTSFGYAKHRLDRDLAL
jgi:hypothetical protein